MFVSAYSTFTNVASTKGTPKGSKKEFNSSFSLEKKEENLPTLSTRHTTLPINYISDYKVFSNKQKLFEHFQSKDLQKYKAIKTKKKAKVAYENNFRISRGYKKPLSQPVVQPPVLNNKSITAKILNTYAENDRYYQLSVA